jgi:phospholipid transport system substrate-binding protein
MIARNRSLFAPWLAATLAFTLVGVGAASGASAQPRPQGASAFLEGRHEEVNRLLRQPANDDAARQRRSERLTRMLSDLLDYQELSRRALGDQWTQRSEAERQQFVTLLRQLVERNYETNLERTLEYEVTYDRESRRGELTVVHTTARSRTQRRQPPVAIDYVMRSADGSWRVVDVSTDGVSMVDNYRSQFSRIISREGWNELIARMQRRLAQGASDT